MADGKVLAEGVIDAIHAGSVFPDGGGHHCGYSNGLPVTDDIHPPGEFSGSIESVTIDVNGTPFVDPEKEAEAVIAMQ